jgi:hypothetical protein
LTQRSASFAAEFGVEVEAVAEPAPAEGSTSAAGSWTRAFRSVTDTVHLKVELLRLGQVIDAVECLVLPGGLQDDSP